MDPTLPLIVAVDDEPDDLFFLRHAIGKTGIAHRFQPFSNAEAAMFALSAASDPALTIDLPVICFLDIRMVGMSGFDLLKWIREQRRLDSMPAVMVSSSDHPSDVDRARDVGAQGYLKKYPSILAMRAVLQQAIEARAASAAPPHFLRWTYGFVEPSVASMAKVAAAGG